MKKKKAAKEATVLKEVVAKEVACSVQELGDCLGQERDDCPKCRESKC